ncbi:MAG: HAMP domain-containing protein [Magnetococcales bacterium]|nr:HAMP domain-containing protein [Magnetococcales bacterium]
MSLQLRLSIIISVAITLQVVLTMVIQETMVTPRFIALEKKEAAKNLDRVVESIQRERKHISLLSSDWAAWEDAYEFVNHPSQAFIASNLNPESLAGIRLNLIYFYDLQGTLVWGKYYDAARKAFVPWPDLPPRITDAMKTLITHKDERDEHIELLMSSTGPMMLAARPIVHTGFKGPIRGTLMMGRLLDQELFRELVEQTHVSFQVFASGSDGRFSEEQQAIVEQLTAGNPVLWQDDDQDQRVGYTLIKDYQGRPGLLIRAETPREITNEGQSAYWGTLFSTLIQGLVILGILLATLHRLIIRPLNDLNARIATVATHGDLTSRTGIQGNDEIGLLARQFDTMVASLADIVGKIHLHSHALDATVHALGASKESLEKDARTTQELAQETISAYQELEENMETLRQAVMITNQEVAGMTTATHGLGSNLENIAHATTQASSQIDTMETAAREITGHIDGVRENLGQVEGAILSISQAVNDLSSSLAEVRTQSGTTARESEQARHHADDADKVTQRLSNSATSIGNVVDVINNIAEQTNMLALNASIEAAGAGSAGAGFAVVADEVKVLAQQTAKATEMISERIQEIQDISRENGRAFAAVITSINRIHNGNQTIAQAVKLQSSRLEDIAQSLSGVTHASSEVQHRVHDLGQSAFNVTQSVEHVARETRDIAQSVDHASEDAQKLVAQSGTMDATAHRMHDATLRGNETTTLARTRLDAITRQIHLLSGMIHHMAHLVATAAAPGHRLLEAAETLNIGPSPFDVGLIKRQFLELSAAIEKAQWEQVEPAPMNITSLLQEFNQQAIQNVVEACKHSAHPHEPFQTFFSELQQQCTNVTLNDRRQCSDVLSAMQQRFFSILDELYLHVRRQSAKKN